MGKTVSYAVNIIGRCLARQFRRYRALCHRRMRSCTARQALRTALWGALLLCCCALPLWPCLLWRALSRICHRILAWRYGAGDDDDSNDDSGGGFNYFDDDDNDDDDNDSDYYDYRDIGEKNDVNEWLPLPQRMPVVEPPTSSSSSWSSPSSPSSSSSSRPPRTIPPSSPQPPLLRASPPPVSGSLSPSLVVTRPPPLTPPVLTAIRVVDVIRLRPALAEVTTIANRASAIALCEYWLRRGCSVSVQHDAPCGAQLRQCSSVVAGDGVATLDRQARVLLLAGARDAVTHVLGDSYSVLAAAAPTSQSPGASTSMQVIEIRDNERAPSLWWVTGNGASACNAVALRFALQCASVLLLCVREDGTAESYCARRFSMVDAIGMPPRERDWDMCAVALPPFVLVVHWDNAVRSDAALTQWRREFERANPPEEPTGGSNTPESRTWLAWMVDSGDSDRALAAVRQVHIFLGADDGDADVRQHNKACRDIVASVLHGHGSTHRSEASGARLSVPEALQTMQTAFPHLVQHTIVLACDADGGSLQWYVPPTPPLAQFTPIDVWLSASESGTLQLLWRRHKSNVANCMTIAWRGVGDARTLHVSVRLQRWSSSLTSIGFASRDAVSWPTVAAFVQAAINC